MKRKLNFFWPSIVYECKGEYYIHRAWFHNELTNHFSVRLFAKLERRESVDEVELQQLDPEIDCIDFLDQTDSIHFLKNYRRYRKEIFQQTDPELDLYFVMYPLRKTSLFITHILSDTKLIIWVKSDYVGLFGVPDDSLPRSLFKNLAAPMISFVYPRVSERLFRDNVIFYTGDIIYNTENHRSQYGITSLSPMNNDPFRIRRSIENDVVFVGDEGNQKGLRFLLEALDTIDRELQLTIIGLDELNRYSEYKSRLEIKTLGTIYEHDKFYNCLADHDVLVMPSICERQGKVQLEAMSAGVVPICSDSGGTYTTIDNLYNGILFEQQNTSELVNAIEMIYESESLYRTLQKNGLKYTDRLSVKRQVDNMATIIKHHYY